MNVSHDVIVVGAGPAGIAAAIAAKRSGLDVLLIDEQPRAGGQVYRAPACGEGDAKGAELRSALANSQVPTRFGCRIWSAEPEWRLFTVQGEAVQTLEARAAILATGAQERVAPVPGWTLPGAIGLAAATVLVKAQKVLPGRCVVVAGQGPLLLLVASLILEGGGRVAAVIDANPAGAWLRSGAALASRPDLVARGARWLAQVVARRVPVMFGSRVVRVLGEERVEGVEVQSGEQRRTIACDALCRGNGLTPASEIARQLGARHRFAPELGGWITETDPDGRTSMPRLYCCGDGAGVLGAEAAPLRGVLAARAAAQDLGLPIEDPTRLRRRLARAARFGAAMSRLAPASLDIVADADEDTIVCRCESVRRGAIDATIDCGALTASAVKSVTRCGMGPCGARFCGEAMAALIAIRTGRSLAEVEPAPARPPFRPLPIAALSGGFRYDDIPFPEPSPL